MISKLPIEIMDRIFGYLYQEDKLNLAQVSQHLGSVYGYHARQTHKNANSMDEIFNLIVKHCVHLESAHVNITPLNFNSCKYLLAIKGLINISLVFNIENYQESDLLQYINPDCKVLTVEQISDYQAENIRQLIHLEELEIRWPNENLRNIFSIGSNLKKLRVLRLYRCTHSPAFHLQDIEYPELEKLSLCGGIIHAVLPKCPKITFLDLRTRFKTNFCDSIARYGSTLEHVIIGSCAYDGNTLTGQQFIKVLRECKKLKRLGASIDLMKILFNEYLQSFIDLLKERGFNKERRFVINFRGGYFFGKHQEWNKTVDPEVWNLITLDEKII